MSALVPALDLRPSNDDAPRALPSSLDAEQALLGAVLYDNAAYERAERVRPEHFFEPFHGRLWALMEAALRKGQLAEPILLAEQLGDDPAWEGLGGLRYLADLVDRAPPAANAGQYAGIVVDLWARRELIAACEAGIERAHSGGEETAREHIEAVEADLYALAETETRGGFRPFAEYVTGAVTMAAEAHSRDGGLSGLSTGLSDLDRKLGGLHPSDLVIIAARPSMGKSSLAVNIAFDCARNYRWEPQPDGARKTVSGGIVAFFSLEMSGDQLAMRIIAERAGVSGDRIRRGEIDALEFARVRDAALEVQDAPLHVDDTGGLLLAKICARARRLKRTVGLDLLIVDYLQLVDSGLPGRDNRVQQVSHITGGLKALAKELAIPVIALAQLSRQVESRDDKKPQLADLRESGSIEQDADMVLFIYRESYYLTRLEPRPGTQEHMDWQGKMDQCQGLAEIIVGKQRHGPIGTVRVAFDEALTRFSDLARDGDYAARSPYGDDR